MNMLSIKEYDKEKGIRILETERTNGKLYLVTREVFGNRVYEYRDLLVPCGPRRATFKVDDLGWNE